MRKSDLPFGSEFSPSQVDLPELLVMARHHGGDWKAFEAAVRAAYFEDHDADDYNRGKLANNTKLGMVAYGIIDRDANLTSLGETLFAIRDDLPSLHEALARHILLNLHGMTMVQCVRDMQAAGETVTLVRLRAWLEEGGIHLPRGTKHLSSMSLWLETAGVLSASPEWTVNEARLAAVAGITAGEFDILSSFTREQACYLRALANVGGDGPLPANEIEKLASVTYGVRFNEKSLPKDVLNPLQDAGYISAERTTGGRGGKSGLVRMTPKLKADLVEPLLKQIAAQVKRELRPYLRQTLPNMLAKLDSADKHVKGLALEALALKLMRLLDMDYIATRLRGTDATGAGVDLLFESSSHVFSRWQVHATDGQCLTVDDLALQVGLLYVTGADAVLAVCTGTAADAAREYADLTNRDLRVPVVIVDGDGLREVSVRPRRLRQMVQRQTTSVRAGRTRDGQEGATRGAPAFTV